MSDSAANVNERVLDRPPIPKYFKYDEKNREEFLSQIGNFADERRRFFAKLCEMWTPEIPYAKGAVKSGIQFNSNGFKSFMDRLSKAHCGLIKKQFKQGKIEPESVILTERDSIRFFYHYIESEYQQNFTSDRIPFLSYERLAGEKMVPPDEYIDVVAPEHLSEAYRQRFQNEIRIGKITGIGNSDILMTPRTIPYLVKIARFKIRVVLKSDMIMTMLSKLLGLKTSEVYNHVRTGDNTYWQKIVGAIKDHADEFKTRHKNIPEDFFVSAEILSAYIGNELVAAQQQREVEGQLREKMGVICQELLTGGKTIYDMQEFAKLMETYTEKWPDFADKFYETHIRTSEGKGLPTIVFTGTHYIHRDHIYPLFKELVNTYSEEFEDIYVNIMERIIRTNNRDKNTFFSSHASFISDILARIEKEDKFLHSLFNKPRIVSEAIIHYGKTKLKLKTMERMKDLLYCYFQEGVVKYKSLDTLFGLYRKDIFDKAYFRISFFRRLYLKLSGRYESYYETFIGLSRKDDPSAVKKNFSGYKGDINGLNLRGSQSSLSLLSTHTGRKRSRVNESQRRRSRKSQAKSALVSSRRRSPSPPPKKRSYSVKQIENSWDEFGDIMSRKK